MAEVTVPADPLQSPAGGKANAVEPAGGDDSGIESPLLAAIDVGTNSLHLLVARPTGDDRFVTVTRDKEMVRLGSGGGDMKWLSDDAITRGVEALKRFRQAAESSGAEVLAVATSAVREADNRKHFLDRARSEAGVEVEVISGWEEARLVHLGVVQDVPVFDRRVLVVDIGGGSTELAVGQARELIAARSLKLGAIRLSDRFFADEALDPEQLAACRRYVAAYLAPVAGDIGGAGFEVAVGSSGTIKNLAEMALVRRGATSPRSLSNVTFSRSDLDGVLGDLSGAATVAERLAVPGLDANRADIILGGAVLLEQVFCALGIEEMTVSDYALREGVVLDALQRRHQPSLDRLSDLRYHSVVHLASVCPGERPHGEHTRDLALQLFDGTAEVHGLDSSAREHLEAAALLANVGLSISHDRHHLHSYYVIRNSERLAGFTDHEIELIAQVARYHRKSEPKAKHEAFAALNAKDQAVVRTLAGMLRICIALDRTRSAAVRSLRCRRLAGTLTVVLDTGGADASLEVYTAEWRRRLLEEVLGVDICFATVTGS